MDGNGSRRTARLNKVFQDIIRGEKPINPSNGALFLEAIYKQDDAAACLERLFGNPSGLNSLQTAIRYDLSPAFLNGHASSLLQYLQNPDIIAINNGLFLNDILLKIVEPPIFWMEFRKAFLKGDLDENATIAFGWLLYRLCLLPSGAGIYQDDPDMKTILSRFSASTSSKVKFFGHQIQDVLDTCDSFHTLATAVSSAGPGGRHDNDYSDFRKISILPTSEEIECPAPPFLRPSSVLEDPATEPTRVAMHLDNQFRLLREDMIYEMRDELQVATGKKKGYHRGVRVDGLRVKGVECGEAGKRDKWGLVCVCKEELPQLAKLDVAHRKAYLKEKPNFLKHQSLACLLAGKEIIGFPSILRDEARLVKSPPEIILQFEGDESTKNALLKLKLQNDITLVQINTAVFAFEPILKGLQQAKTLPLSSELLLWKEGDVSEEAETQADSVIRALRINPRYNLKHILDLDKDVILDDSQAKSLILGLTQKVSLIQGPPGTGKSFIGALIAKAIHNYTEQTILVVCYTNHALDDILTSFLDNGIPESSMVRLGFKATPRTESLLINKQPRTSGRSRSEWTVIDEMKGQVEKLVHDLKLGFNRYSSRTDLKDVLGFLEFLDDGPPFFDAFTIPSSEDGMSIVGKDNKAIESDYLLARWINGEDAGIAFADHVVRSEAIKDIWELPESRRTVLFTEWEKALLQESIEAFSKISEEYTRSHRRLMGALRSDTASTLRSKRIVGCTTTAAAKYREEIQIFNPDVLLVEEAGEILESHVLLSLGPETSQMILIGDHKQLRPKVNNYALTVEKGDGLDLNRSLFERLILKDYPHATLSQQHRMRPEISALIRHLTYPELSDAPRTKNRPDILGLCDNIVFINHDHPEDDNKQLADKRDMASTSSKQNTYEINMILKIVRYLGQQGYGTNELVLLTPYLGQLQKLREMLKKDNDPILNDLDSHELIRAGLLDPAAAKLTKKPIRLATIDNYQGEESDIVIVSLTRSNPRCDIGFMFSPERLNVLLSRARNGLIMLGNANTFKNARKGKELWQDLFGLLADGKHMYQGLPVKCQRHESATQTLSNPEDFDSLCPDGGCLIPCGAILSCKLHTCPLKCHQVQDHSKMACEEPMSSLCTDGHPLHWRCSRGPPQVCSKCERAKKLAKEHKEQEQAAKERRDAEQKAHFEAMDALNDQIERTRQRRAEEQLAHERARAIAQKRQDLDDMEAASFVSSSPPSNAIPLPPQSPTAQQRPVSPVANISSYPSSPKASNTPPNVSSPKDADSKPSLFGKMWNTISSSISSAIPIDPSAGSKPSSKSSGNAKPFKKLPDSESKMEWERQKNVHGARNPAIDEIMDMTGLEAVKKQVMAIQAKIDTTIRQNTSLRQERFNAVLLGNPGTGKTTVARHYAKFLASVKAIPGETFEERTGARLAQEGVDAAKKLVEDVTTAGGGAIFIDEAYQLTSGNNYGGPAVLDYLLAEMENRVGTLVFILAGYNKEMEKFFEHNPGLKSRVPYQFQFDDYRDEELMSMLEGIVRKKYSGHMKIEDNLDGLYGRIVIRRLGRRRGQPGFGNARDLQAVFSRICERQAVRLTKGRKQGLRPDDFLMVAQDLIGPDPSEAIRDSEAWTQLQKMIGLKAVKETITSLINVISENYQRELLEREPIALSLNRVFLGSPGTGKTTVAKLYGQILADIGLLSNGEVVLKNPADFVGAVLGASEANTKAILANSVGKVLIIDEAYMLYGGGGDNQSGGQSNQFKTSVIDTIVAEVQNTPGEDRCVLLLGYENQMLEMFQNVNPGLSRRFKIEEAFKFEDFTDSELRSILELKLNQQDLDATEPAKNVAIELLARMRNRPNFGNGGEVENAITQAKTRALARRGRMPASERPIDITFEPEDFDPDYNRGAKAATNLTKLFEDIVGHDDIKQRLANYQQLAQVCKARNIDPRDQVPTNFIFTGAPGTGKTTVARKVGQVFYDMGLLASTDVIECSASDLVGQYVGQTGPKTRKLFDKALGKVLFIDEAYRLSEGHFTQEAIDELVGLLTHETYKSKLIVILAGYEEDMNRLMTANTGLPSRFPHQVVFPNMSAEHCLKVVGKELIKKQVKIDDWDEESSAFWVEIKELIRDLMELPDWGNARDMMTLAKEMISVALLKGSMDPNPSGELLLSSDEALNVVKNMVNDKKRRATIPKKHRAHSVLPTQSFTRDPAPPPATSVGTSSTTASPPPPTPAQQPPPNSPQTRGRGAAPARGSNARARARGGGAALGGRGGHKHNSSDSASPAQSSPAQPQPVPLPHTPGPQPTNYNTGPTRDPGVSDPIWRQMGAAKRAAAEIERQARAQLRELQEKLAIEKRAEEERKRALRELERAQAQARDEARSAQIAELMRQRKAAQLARERAEAALRAKQEAERQRKQREEQAQRKLKELGVCVAGFQWIKMGSSYRCAGGSHVVHESQLGL